MWNNYAILSDLIKLCEYMYRKGVLDAATSGDAGEIDECAKREDNYSTFRFLLDDGIMSDRLYCDYICMICSKIDANRLRNTVLYPSSMNKNKISICVAAEHSYRQGLLDGKSYSKFDAENLFKFDDGYLTHTRIGMKKKLNKFKMADKLKYELSVIHDNRVATKTRPSIFYVCTLIRNGIYEYKIKRNGSAHS